MLCSHSLCYVTVLTLCYALILYILCTNTVHVYLSSHTSCRAGCESLCDVAIKEPDADNVTVIVVSLQFAKDEHLTADAAAADGIARLAL